MGENGVPDDPLKIAGVDDVVEFAPLTADTKITQYQVRRCHEPQPLPLASSSCLLSRRELHDLAAACSQVVRNTDDYYTFSVVLRIVQEKDCTKVPRPSDQHRPRTAHCAPSRRSTGRRRQRTW